MNLKILIFEVKINTSKFELLKHLGGSTGADLYIDKKDNKKYVVKKGASIKQMYSEYIANKLYSKFGIKVPKSYIGKINNEPVFVSQFLEDSVPLGDTDISKLSNKLAKGFILDVILANWDVLGTNMNLDNVRYYNGDLYRVDLGGSMFYRAMGGFKSQFTDVPTEQDTLRKILDKVYGKLTDANIKEMINKLSHQFIVNNKVDIKLFIAYVKKIVYDKDNEMSNEEKEKLYKTIVKRTINLYKIFNS